MRIERLLPTKARITPSAMDASGLRLADDKGLGIDTLLTSARHLDAGFTATDGQRIAYRVTPTVGQPRAVFVMQQGTLGKPAYFDAMGEQLAKAGIRSYALGSRVQAPDFHQHSQDLESLVALARRENPGVPIRVGGVSLGAMIALDWGARFDTTRTPVVAMSPVVLSRFMSPADYAKLAVGFASPTLAGRLTVDTPMSAHRPLTTNPASPEAHLLDPDGMRVPASLFDDVVRMTGETALHGPKMAYPLFIAMGGADRVACNPATRVFSTLLRSPAKTVRTFPGAAHDLSQETNHADLVSALQGWILQGT